MILGFALIICGAGISNKLMSRQKLFNHEVSAEKTQTEDVEGGELPAHCRPIVIKAMLYAWQDSKNGWAKEEFGFISYRNGDNTDGITRLPYTGQYKEITIRLRDVLPHGAKLTAIYHTHPNFDGDVPSPNDRSISDLLRVPIYVISKNGLNVYSPQQNQTIELRRYMNWVKPCS